MAGRLIVADPADGVTNMAVDQWLLQAAQQHGQVALRIYQWSQPTLSLGYFQAFQERHEHPCSQDLPCVRRRTGGGAIVHDRELTYCLAMPAGTGPQGCEQLYRVVHHAIVRALGRLAIHAAMRGPSRRSTAPEPFLCFLRRSPHDIVVNGRKIVGSAQRRSAGASLQHGSILLQTSQWAPEVPGLRPAESEVIPPTTLRNCLVRELETGIGLRFVPSRLSDREARAARDIATNRFARPAWNRKR